VVAADSLEAHNDAMAIGIRLQGVTKRYGDIPVVDRIDLMVQPGLATVILGPSGCGKTTTLRLMAGLVAPDEGLIFLDDLEVSSPTSMLPPNRRGVGMVFQSLALWPHMTVEGNLAFVAKKAGKEKIQEALELVDLWPRRGSYPAELSGGEQQRVALARALVSTPRLLLLDEPLSSLDEGLRKKMLESMTRLKEKLGVTTVFVTHSQQEALAFADRIVVMWKGRILQQGAPKEVYNRPVSALVARFLGDANLLPAVVKEDGAAETILGRIEAADRPPGPALAFIRPENVTVVERDEAITGRVISTTFAGSRSLVTVNVAGVEVVASADAEPEVGSEVGLRMRCDPLLLDVEEHNDTGGEP
jgi:putative spermidine/putrescine transport system ATP-binding protein